MTKRLSSHRIPAGIERFFALTVFLCAALHAAEEIPATGESRPELKSFDDLMFSFMREKNIPGASLAVARNGKLLYARGFGYADREAKTPVNPTALFRIASISKPFTSAAVMQWVEKGKLKLDDKAAEILGIGDVADERFKSVTILQLLQHTGGWDRAISGDPMFRSPEICKALHCDAPARQADIIKFMARQKLDFDPGTRSAYSNFGYCILGRVIEKVSGQSYEDDVKSNVLAPLGISSMRLGKTRRGEKLENEVCYYDRGGKRVPSLFPEDHGEAVPEPYGRWCLEAMDSHGAWLASAPDLVRFGAAFDDAEKSKILSAASIAAIFAPPPGATGHNADGTPKTVFYGCGWQVRAVGNGKINTWHNGALSGTSTLLVRRFDGLTWAVLFNTDFTPDGKRPADAIDSLLHQAAAKVKDWPEAEVMAK